MNTQNISHEVYFYKCALSVDEMRTEKSAVNDYKFIELLIISIIVRNFHLRNIIK